MTPRDPLFVVGQVPPSDADSVAARWRQLPGVGGTAWFFGQVRGDQTENGTVTAIEYTAYRPLADEELRNIMAEVLDREGLVDLFVRHSLEVVPVGGIAMMIGVAGGHRREVFAALPWVVDEIKQRVPIFGKELTDEDGHRWKVNT
jgi:molybdopterin synthase catalytic subunit